MDDGRSGDLVGEDAAARRDVAMTQSPQRPPDPSTLSFESLKEFGASNRAGSNAASATPPTGPSGRGASVPALAGAVVTTIEGLSRDGAALALAEVMSALLGHHQNADEHTG